MEVERYRPGQVVVSRAGRDAGRYFMVLAVRDALRVAVVDGAWRRVRNPKYKNIKHLSYLAEPDPEVGRRISNGEKITDADIRRVLWVLAEKEGYQ